MMESKFKTMHRNTKDITGQKFERLLALERTELQYRGQYIWLFKCDCGNEVNIPIGWVMSGNTRSCGCLHDERVVKYNAEAKRKPDNASNKNGLYNHYKAHARHRKIEFQLTKEEFNNLIFSDCYYCGESPTRMFRLNAHSGEMACNGVDRIDSSLGYTIENTVPCCKQCNTMKNAYTTEEFYSKIKQIYNQQKLGDRIANIQLWDGIKQ